MRDTEIIIAEIKSQPQRHAEKWETQFDHNGFESWIYLDKMFPPGKVRITIETHSSEQSTKEEN